ncbi:MAG: Holliday junction branch migration protein RuvA [Candidatus Nomurabacteria bacterium]|jgi:Holliday junction DNA helicase RuvA|nr:Holliday junction branch migration protein RuvA [Candidatus Nomurabacteria bacterium]
MIAHLKGVIAERFGNSVIVDVAGVGYEVLVTSIDAEALVLEAQVKIYTYHHVREQIEELFGFLSLEGKKLFELLITVQGVGPKNAMGILSLASSEEVRNAIANADAAFIAKASGVGKKSAERVIVNLRDKVGLPAYYGRKSEMGVEFARADEALEALMALGFQLADATRALADIDMNLPVEDRIRLALKQ